MVNRHGCMTLVNGVPYVLYYRGTYKNVALLDTSNSTIITTVEGTYPKKCLYMDKSWYMLVDDCLYIYKKSKVVKVNDVSALYEYKDTILFVNNGVTYNIDGTIFKDKEVIATKNTCYLVDVKDKNLYLIDIETECSYYKPLSGLWYTLHTDGYAVFITEGYKEVSDEKRVSSLFILTSNGWERVSDVSEDAWLGYTSVKSEDNAYICASSCTDVEEDREGVIYVYKEGLFGYTLRYKINHIATGDDTGSDLAIDNNKLYVLSPIVRLGGYRPCIDVFNLDLETYTHIDNISLL